jgi:hypothetical protein
MSSSDKTSSIEVKRLASADAGYEPPSVLEFNEKNEEVMIGEHLLAINDSRVETATSAALDRAATDESESF